jgi:hypothetical protein
MTDKANEYPPEAECYTYLSCSCGKVSQTLLSWRHYGVLPVIVHDQVIIHNLLTQCIEGP